jgi:hypothetical protein
MLMSVSGLISTLASIIQQCHTVARWTDIKIEQHAYALAHPGKPEMVVAGASRGLDLAMFYMREFVVRGRETAWASSSDSPQYTRASTNSPRQNCTATTPRRSSSRRGPSP